MCRCTDMYTVYRPSTDVLLVTETLVDDVSEDDVILCFDTRWYTERRISFPRSVSSEWKQFDLLQFHYVYSKIASQAHGTTLLIDRFWKEMTKTLLYVGETSVRMVGYQMTPEEQERFLLSETPNGFFFTYLSSVETCHDIPDVSFTLQCIEFYDGHDGLVVHECLLNPGCPPATREDRYKLQEFITGLKQRYRVDSMYELIVLDSAQHRKCRSLDASPSIPHREVMETIYEMALETISSQHAIMASTTYTYANGAPFNALVELCMRGEAHEAIVVSTKYVQVTVDVKGYPVKRGDVRMPQHTLLYVYMCQFIEHFGYKGLLPYCEGRRKVQSYMRSLGVRFDANKDCCFVFRQCIPYSDAVLSVCQTIHLFDPEGDTSVAFDDLEVSDPLLLESHFQTPGAAFLKSVIARLVSVYIAVHATIPTVSSEFCVDAMHEAQRVISNRNAEQLLYELEMEEAQKYKKKERRSKRKQKQKIRAQQHKCRQLPAWNMWQNPWYGPVHHALSEMRQN